MLFGLNDNEHGIKALPMDIHPIDTHLECQMIKIDRSSSYRMADCVETRPHLILHFDVNRTLIFSDVAQKQTPEDIIVNGLADRLEYLWDDSLAHPVNYTNYVKYHLFPNPKRSKEIKQKQKEQTTRFLQFLQESGHPLYPHAQALFDRAKRALEGQSTLVFSSFYNLLGHLKNQNISYTLVFRTFGSDIRDVAEELNEEMGHGFLTDFHVLSQGVFSPKDSLETDLYDYVKNARHHIAIQDDWTWWFNHGENYQYGKPFPIDLEDSSVCSLFFDDNASINRDHPEKNIVAPFDISKNVGMSPEVLIAKKRLFPVDTLEALCNENYFIEIIDGIIFPARR